LTSPIVLETVMDGLNKLPEGNPIDRVSPHLRTPMSVSQKAYKTSTTQTTCKRQGKNSTDRAPHIRTNGQDDG
jgi:hypothetical protein